MAGPEPQYIVCLNSTMVGLPFSTQDLAGGPAAWAPTVTMAGSVAEPALHPLIHDWYDGGDPSSEYLNIDPYRKAMSLTYAYLASADGGEGLLNNYEHETHDLVLNFSNDTPFLYVEGDSSVAPALLGSLADPSAGWTFPLSDLDWGVVQYMSVKFYNQGWNGPVNAAGSVISPQYEDLLDEENMGEWNEGDPYFHQYLLGGSALSPSNPLAPGPSNPRLTLAGQAGSYDGLFAHLIQPDGPVTLFDHTFGYLNGNAYNPEDPSIPHPLFPAFTVEGEYNFYVDSAPDYESVIRPDRIPECALPNYYMLEAAVLESLQPSIERPNAYLNQVSLLTRNSSFTDLFASMASATPTSDPLISEGYWNLYSSVLGGQHPAVGEIQDADLEKFEMMYKSIVIPHESLDFIADFNGHGSLSGDPLNPGPTGPFTAISSYPFYNKITLNPMPVPGAADPNLGLERGNYTFWLDHPTGDFWRDFLSGILSPGTLTVDQRSCFVRALQLLIANSYNPNMPLDPVDEYTGILDTNVMGAYRRSIPLDLNYMGQGVGAFNEKGWTNQDMVQNLGKNQPIKVCAELDKMHDTVYGPMSSFTHKDSNYPSYYLYMAQPGAIGEINYSILRDTFVGEPNSTPPTWHHAGSPSAVGEIREMIQRVTRNLNSVFKGELSNVSPLMYVLEKRRIPEGELSVPLSVEPVQRIFITRDFTTDPSPIIYYDTQVKYGVGYQYDCRLINVVFGTQYMYTSVSPHFPFETEEVTTLESDSMGRALANALGFYREERADITTLGNHLAATFLDESQYNYMKLSNEFELASPQISPVPDDPSMYFLDEGPLGWPGVPYQTDVGADGGWDLANNPEGECSDFHHGGHAGCYYAQTGFYVFGGPSSWSDWTMDFANYYENTIPSTFGMPQATIPDEFGPPGSILHAPKGGMYAPTWRDDMLARMRVRVVDGLGHNGNETGGLVPVDEPEVPDPTMPGEIDAPTPELATACEWVKQFHTNIAEAFRDWYTEDFTFKNIMLNDLNTDMVSEAQRYPGQFLEWIQQGAPLDTLSMWSTSAIVERWYRGDSYYLQGDRWPALASGYPPGGEIMFGNSNTLVGGTPNTFSMERWPPMECAWYCPNWGTLNNWGGRISGAPGLWRPHNHQQIIYWLGFNSPGTAHRPGDEQWINDYTGYSTGYSSRAYLWAKSDLGTNHGNDIMERFMTWWNNGAWQNYQNAAGISSRSHIGVQVPLLGDAVDVMGDMPGGDTGNAFNWSQFEYMIERLYWPNFNWATEPCGEWETPVTLIVANGGY